MRKVFHLLLVLAVPGCAFAQKTGNEWINFGQSYYKIPIGADGIYRLTYHNLSAAGFPVGSVDPRMIQLLHRGTEQAIFVAGGEDGNLGPSDYIEFYGQRNDGTLDTELYVSPDAQPHSYYNLYSDTTAYFLTIAGSAGKRMGVSDLPVPATKPPEAFHWDEKLQLYTKAYSAGRVYGLDIYLTRFDYGEGWTGGRIRRGQHGDYPITGIRETYTSGPAPHLEILLTGRNNLPHNVDIMVGPTTATLRLLENVTFSSYDNRTVTGDINWSDIGADGNLVVRMKVNDTGKQDYVSIAYIKLRYPQLLIMGPAMVKTLRIPPNPSGSSLVKISGVPDPAVIYDITETGNVYRLAYTRTGNQVAFLAPGTASGRKVLVHAASAQTPSLQRVHFRQINPSGHNYLIITNRALRQLDGKVNDPVKAYGAYRASAEGGGFDTLIVNMQQLYNQFSYGEITPLSIRRFARFMLGKGDPEYLFLIGRGLSVSEDPHRVEVSGYADLVPTAGEPGSDIAFTAGLTPEDPFTPAIPTGRLTALNAQEVLNYLIKVKEMEKVPYSALWRKKLIHLSGGRSVSELNLFKGYVNDFKAVAEGHYLGGQVVTLSKQTNHAVELINIADQVNEGTTLITFFGHSSPEFTDIEIGLVSDPAQGYNNQGKYPMILVNGCDAGNIFSSVPTFGEDWMVAEKDKGAIGFIAHSATGLSPNLKNYSDIFYGTAFGDSSFINKPIGDIQKEVGRQYIARFSPDPANIAQVQQMVYQGDPFIRLFGADKPDYEINNESLFLEPFGSGAVNALADSFKIGVIVRNFGITGHDSLWLQVQRTLSNGAILQYDSVPCAPVFYQDTLYFTVQNLNKAVFGENRFTVSLDPVEAIAEMDESNNVAVWSTFINLPGTSNLMPGEFSIVNSTRIMLVAQSNAVFPEEREFLTELDTTKSFNSPLKRQHRTVAAKLATWAMDLPASATMQDSIVYYWRSKFSQLKEGEDTSRAVSFTYINHGPEGWAQVDFPQFEHNAVSGLDRKAGKWKFKETVNEISVITFGKDSTGANIQFFSNGTPYFREAKFQYCFENSINAVAFDKATAAPYLVFQRSSIFDRSACGRLPQVINSFTNQNIQNDGKLDSYIGAVPEGDYILLFSAGNVTYESWPEATWEKLDAIGAPASLKATLQNGAPFIIVGKKGSGPGTATVAVGDASLPVPVTQQRIMLESTVVGKFSQGTITSPRIGPAASWETIHTGFLAVEEGKDEVYYDVIGIDINNNKTVLFEGIESDELDISGVEPAQFPYLQLQASVKDEVDLTAAQLDKWLVLFTPVPEGVLLLQDPTAANYKNIPRTEGEEFTTDFIFKNISNRDFTDSLTVRYTVFNHSMRRTDEYSMRLPPLPAGDTVAFSIELSTMDRIGDNDLTVNINPRILPEQNYNNNIIQLNRYFSVEGDKTNPLVDVAFDGQYIMDGDIVSPNPLITVVMRDPDALLKKQDTTGMALFLKRPCQSCVFEKVSFSDRKVNWFPATEDSDFKIAFRPGKLEDGLHTLRVQVEDASGNRAGEKPYSIQFEVINKSSITHFYPYPNPFSTSTRFVFTLTGSELPDEIKIQILTVTGKIVREITQSELGPIHIGHNISDYAWNGKDEFGDQLANGVYLYRVIVRNNGQGIERRRTKADHAFKKGYGKIYLLR